MANHAHRLLASALFLAVLTVGCAKRADSGAAPASAAAAAFDEASPSAEDATTRNADVEHGKELYTQVQCSACHATDGSGGVGPNLHGEKTKKNLAAAIAWIENPDPPMPKLYPSPLSRRDVRDVAAYVETL